MLCEPFGEVEAEAVYFVFCEQELEVAFDVVANLGALMVEVVEYAVWVWCIDVEPGVVGQRFAGGAVPPEFAVGVVTCCVVVYYVEEYGNAPFVAFVDEAAVVFFGSVCFVECEEEAGIVSPTDVAKVSSALSGLSAPARISRSIVSLPSSSVMRPM